MKPEEMLHPLDAALMELHLPLSGIEFPPKDFSFFQMWGVGYAFSHNSGLRLIIDCSKKADDKWWIHISVSRRNRIPTHEDMIRVKKAFLGNWYAYSVYPPEDKYVNLHKFCLHIWCQVNDKNGQVLPEFSEELPFGRSV